MAKRKGEIRVETQNIFPIIKKWLYSEHDIFLRELVSNACDAITKRAALGRGQNVEIPEGEVSVIIDSKNNLIRIVDNGVGMSEEEVEKYIANLAFSGAEEFAKKMEEFKSTDVSREDIIGKFGLGFYSAFMVSDKVEVDTLSMNKGATAVKWTCSGDTEYEFDKGERAEVGTTITLHINEESKDFLEAGKTRTVLSRYCDFMAYPIVFRDLVAEKTEAETEAKNKKDAEEKGNEYITPEKSIDKINDEEPLWKKAPSELKDEDYKKFFNKLFPMDPEPLFWIHLNIDHPFELQGILYFPKLNPAKPMNEANIKLYCKQVFVSDNIKHIVPDFLGLLKGVIDSTDIPLNVSRSSLQGDPNVKKISNYIVKKVAESLKKLYKTDREKFEAIWPDISLFVKYGSVSDPKFDDLMRPYTLLKASNEKLYTFEEYEDSIPEAFKEKLKGKILSFQKDAPNATLIAELESEGLNSVELDELIDPHYTQHVEFNKKNDKEYKFAPIDEEAQNLLGSTEESEENTSLKNFFFDIMGLKKEEENKEQDVERPSLKENGPSAYYKLDHQMKRFSQMASQFGNPNMAMPVKKTLVVNPNHPLIKNAFKLWQTDDKKDLAKKLGQHVQDLAGLSSEDLDPKEKDAIVRRSQEIISELSNFAL